MKNTAAAPAAKDQRAWARGKLLQARGQLSQCNFDTAEALANEVASAKLTYTTGEDTPAKVLKDVQHARTDPKALLQAARNALGRKDYDQAERYGRLADKHAGLLTFPAWGDTPSKLLKEVASARRKAPPATTQASGPAKPKTAAPAGDKNEQARTMLKQGRTALQAGKIAEAKQCSAQARAMNASLGWWDDNPDKLDNDIRRLEARMKPAKPAQPAATAKAPTKGPGIGVPKTRAEARSRMEMGRKYLAEGKLDEATQVAQAVKAQTGISWGLFDDTPDRLVADVQKARVKRDQAQSVQVMAQARALYAKGDYDGAAKLAHRAQQLHGEYSIWDLGDRPSKLLADVQSAKARSRPSDLPGSKPSGTALASKAQPPASAKLKAQQTVAEAVRLVEESRKANDAVAQVKLSEARKKAAEAQKMGVTYASDEVSPSHIEQMVAMEAKARVDKHMRQSQDTLMQGNRGVAEGHVAQAKKLAVAFGMDARPMDLRLAEVRGTAAPALPVPPVPGSKPAGTGVAQASHQAPAVSHGHALLEKARQELNKGEVSTARRLAEEAMRVEGIQADAMAVLRSIDSEELNQKKLTANRSFDAAMAAYRRKEYGQAQAMIGAIDTRLLDSERQGRLREIYLTPEMSPSKAKPTATAQAPAGGNTGVVRTGGMAPLPNLGQAGTGRATATDQGNGDAIDDYKARQKVLAEMLRKKGLDVQTEASEKFRTGQYQAAMDLLQDYLSELGEQKIDPVEVNRLRRPIDSRLSQFRLMAAQKEMRDGRMAASNAAADRVAKSRQADDVKRKNVEKLMRDFNTAFKEGKYLEAESTAMKAVELDPDNGVANAAVYMARRQRAVLDYRDIKERREGTTLIGLNEAEDEGPPTVIRDKLTYDKGAWDKAKNRKPLTPIKLGRPSEAEKEIERQLSLPVNITFEKTPLADALEELRRINNINIDIDTPALQSQGINPRSEIDIKLDRVSLKSALNLMLHKVGLTYVIKDEVLVITTEENARGKLKTVTHQVADLVIPVHDFGDVRNPSIPGIGAAPQGSGGVASSTPSPVSGPNSLMNGQPVGSAMGSSMMSTSPTTSGVANNGTSVTKGRAATTEEQLIKLVTSTVQPRSWAEMGGPGTVEYFPLTMSLVINQTSDIQEQIQDLLAALRRLQDQEVAVEIRFISVSEEFFERVGVNFSMNILTDTTRYEPQLLTNAHVLDATRFINAFDPKRFIAGLTPAGTLTPTLDIPITQNSFFQTVPNFGGYTAGGLSMGLAFLSDIQVFLFLEAVQGDTRANVMQAPKLTLFNGQTSTLTVNDQKSFVTGVQVAQLPGGQFTFVPQIQPVFNQTTVTIQAVISADRRFVRMSLTPFLSNTVPELLTVFPVVVPIFTSFEGNGSGQPVVFTQLLQQPVITTVSVQTTVAVPDGGTVLMGGLKRLSEARSEYGPPVLSKIPYVNRLFKNVGYGRETDSLLMMVTPRIIIQEEEEERQTGFTTTPALPAR